MSLFRPLRGFFLDELLRHEGLGDAFHNPHLLRDSSNVTNADFQCEACCLAHHRRTPLHIIKEWNGNFWPACMHKMTIIEAPIIHQIKMRYCKCEKSDDADNLQQLMRNAWYPATVTDPRTCATFRSLEVYRLYNVAGNMNVRDFVTALERVTDTTTASGMTWLLDWYKQFQRMARQWAFLWRLIRAGVGHDPAGVESAKLGVCAVNCWGCPHNGRNLPPDW
ncbi:hypothetical protein B0H17DRAFT_1115382 [Mycena rosella]|uniref:CxC2-like cysteine cluster KDZ transposase-associated domain-containing protein n=1 Tax=Mycena rosella TaxID=1033263 RepID=A0AAD7BB93_MYCRO|nr:hypothetical protein B0H17DRAFT_1115382 [Mycena rosella]